MDNFKGKYYELRKCAKQLIFENHALHSEIVQCRGEVCVREAERELLLEHLLQYEQEEWELQREMTNAHTEKHRMIKKQQDADKRKKMRADAAETLMAEEDGQKIPKIKIVFQQKRGPELVDPNISNFELNEAKIAIKNKIKRNKSKLEPIVISLPTSGLNGAETSYHHANKRHKASAPSASSSRDPPYTPHSTSSSHTPYTPQSASSVFSQDFITNFGSSSSSMINSPAPDISPSNSSNMVAESLSNMSNTSDTLLDVFSESDNNDSINVSPSNSGSDISHAEQRESKHLDNKMLFYVDENSLPLSGNESGVNEDNGEKSVDGSLVKS